MRWKSRTSYLDELISIDLDELDRADYDTDEQCMELVGEPHADLVADGSIVLCGDGHWHDAQNCEVCCGCEKMNLIGAKQEDNYFCSMDCGYTWCKDMDEEDEW